jgi:cell wall-associated NlpC family hydrolase
MKHLCFATLTAVVIAAAPGAAGAQTSVNLEKLSKAKNSPASPRFIESIEINPASGNITVTEVSTAKEDKKTQVAENYNSSAVPVIENFNSIRFKYALLTNMEVEALGNTQLYNFIESWWGTRYRYGGQDRDGIDCSAFCNRLCNEVYGLNIDRTAKDQFKQCTKIATDDLQEGDLVFFNTRGGVSHVGLYLGNRYFVHSSVKSGVTISSLDEEYYAKRLISGGRLQK